MVHVYDFFFLFNLESMTIVSCGLGGLEGLIYLRYVLVMHLRITV